MVKRTSTASISEDGGDAEIPNENEKISFDASQEPTKKRLRTKSLYRQPTVNELNRLQETEMLFNSNLFRLQIDEVLDEVKVKEKLEKKFQIWFSELKSHLESIPEDDIEYDLTEKTLFKKLKISSPLCSKLNKTKCVFKFYKFRNIDIVGSYALGCSINHKLQINLQIKVPAETYTKNDSVNYRYHKKRCAYLAIIASHLNKLNTIDDLRYFWLNGDKSKPFLEMKPKGKLGNHLSVRINLTCEEETYKLNRFAPSRNNLRNTWLYPDDKEEKAIEVGPPTPYYNSSVLSDLTADINHTYLNNTLENAENLKQAIVLLKIWLRQRNLQVSGHTVSLFVAYLVDSKRINNFMSSYQIVRNIWIALKSSEWDVKGISLNKNTLSPKIEEFHRHFPVVFLDKTGYYNICWQMFKGTYDALRRESELAVEMLDNPSCNSFIPLFMTPLNNLLQFDHILRFKDLATLKQKVITKASRESRLNYGLDELSLVTHTLHTLISKGLGNRADLILQLVEADFSCPVNSKLEETRDRYEEKLSFGFILNTDNAYNTVEKGPPANLPEAEQFRSFWGDKSELRRFQDGSITETCVWDGEYLLERRGVTRQILDYLLQLKYDVSPCEVYHVYGQCDALLRSREHGAAPLEELSAAVVRAFHALTSELRALTNLPLHISAVHGVSSVLSHASPAPPAPPGARARALAAPLTLRDVPRAPYTPVCRAVIEMGHSGKWPGDIEAFRCLKAAFHLHISERLTKQFGLKCQPYMSHFDVVKDGIVFRLEIGHQKEITIAKREIVNGVVVHRATEESERLVREIVLLPKLRGALHGLQSKHSAYGPTCCIFKRWASSHLVAPPLVAGVVCELVCARVFLCPQPRAPPAGPLPAFLRVLQLLADTDWDNQVLLLDFNGDMKREEIAALEAKLLGDPAKPGLLVGTSLDGEFAGAWGSLAPSREIMRRVGALAKTTLQYMESRLNNCEDNVLPAFVPSLSGYDVLIHLRGELVPRAGLRLDRPVLPRPDPEPLPDSGRGMPLVEFNVVERYLADLRSGYGEFALFFHDAYGGEVIAALWRPGVLGPAPFQVSNANALTPAPGAGHEVNVAALIEDFRIVGAGVVRDITVNTR